MKKRKNETLPGNVDKTGNSEAGQNVKEGPKWPVLNLKLFILTETKGK